MDPTPWGVLDEGSLVSEEGWDLLEHPAEVLQEVVEDLEDAQAIQVDLLVEEDQRVDECLPSVALVAYLPSHEVVEPCQSCQVVAAPCLAFLLHFVEEIADLVVEWTLYEPHHALISSSLASSLRQTSHPPPTPSC